MKIETLVMLDGNEKIIATTFSYWENVDFMALAITHYYVKLVRRIAFKMLGHSKKMERKMQRDARSMVTRQCM